MAGESQACDRGLLAGYRHRAAVDQGALCATLLKVSQLICDLPQVVEMDINPLLADEEGVIALDARVKIRRTTEQGSARLAICPYPSQLEEHLQSAAGPILIRPIRPEDEPRLRSFYADASPSDMRLRFFFVRRVAMAALARSVGFDVRELPDHRTLAMRIALR